MDVDALNNSIVDYPSKGQGNERGGKSSGWITDHTQKLKSDPTTPIKYLLYFSNTYIRQTNRVTHLVNVCVYFKIVNILDVSQKTIQ